MSAQSGIRVNLLLEDKFIISNLDSSKFEQVVRVKGRSSTFDTELTLDLNSTLFPVTTEGEVITLVFAEHLEPTHNRGGTQGTHKLSDLIENADYVMQGRLFHEEEKSEQKRSVYVSFGGLLCQLLGDREVLHDFVLDARIYLMAASQRQQQMAV